MPKNPKPEFNVYGWYSTVCLMHLSSPPVFLWIRVAQSLVFYR